MKKFFILCIGVLYSVACMANEIPIKLFTDPPLPPPPFENKDKDERNLTCEPTAAIDGSSIILYSDVTMEMAVCIYDSNNNLVQSLSLVCINEVDFDLLQTTLGEYRIEITCGEELYYGWFTLN